MATENANLVLKEHLHVVLGGGGGGGEQGKIPSSSVVKLKEKIMNLLSK